MPINYSKKSSEQIPVPKTPLALSYPIYDRNGKDKETKQQTKKRAISNSQNESAVKIKYDEINHALKAKHNMRPRKLKNPQSHFKHCIKEVPEIVREIKDQQQVKPDYKLYDPCSEFLQRRVKKSKPIKALVPIDDMFTMGFTVEELEDSNYNIALWNTPELERRAKEIEHNIISKYGKAGLIDATAQSSKDEVTITDAGDTSDDEYYYSDEEENIATKFYNKMTNMLPTIPKPNIPITVDVSDRTKKLVEEATETMKNPKVTVEVPVLDRIYDSIKDTANAAIDKVKNVEEMIRKLVKSMVPDGVPIDMIVYSLLALFNVYYCDSNIHRATIVAQTLIGYGIKITTNITKMIGAFMSIFKSKELEESEPIAQGLEDYTPSILLGVYDIIVSLIPSWTIPLPNFRSLCKDLHLVKSAGQAIEWFIKIFQQIFFWAYEKIKGEPYTTEENKIAIKAAQDWMIRSRMMLGLDVKEANNYQTQQEIVNHYKRALELITQLESVGVTQYSFTAFYKMFDLFKPIYAKAQEYLSAGQTRQVPCWFEITGTPGAGKSWIVDQICASLAKAYYNELKLAIPPSINDIRFVKVAGNDWFDAYQNQLITLYEDAYQYNEVTELTKEAFSLIQAIGPNPYPLKCANVEKIGNKYFTSPIIMSTSNLIEHGQIKYLENYLLSPDALARRNDILAEININNGYWYLEDQVDSNTGNVRKVKMPIIDKIKKDGFNKAYSFTLHHRRSGSIEAEDVTFHQLLDYMWSKVNMKLETYKEVLETPPMMQDCYTPQLIPLDNRGRHSFDSQKRITKLSANVARAKAWTQKSASLPKGTVAQTLDDDMESEGKRVPHPVEKPEQATLAAYTIVQRFRNAPTKATGLELLYKDLKECKFEKVAHETKYAEIWKHGRYTVCVHHEFKADLFIDDHFLVVDDQHNNFAYKFFADPFIKRKVAKSDAGTMRRSKNFRVIQVGDRFYTWDQVRYAWIEHEDIPVFDSTNILEVHALMEETKNKLLQEDIEFEAMKLSLAAYAGYIMGICAGICVVALTYRITNYFKSFKEPIAQDVVATGVSGTKPVGAQRPRPRHVDTGFVAQSLDQNTEDIISSVSQNMFRCWVLASIDGTSYLQKQSNALAICDNMVLIPKHSIPGELTRVDGSNVLWKGPYLVILYNKKYGLHQFRLDDANVEVIPDRYNDLLSLRIKNLGFKFRAIDHHFIRAAEYQDLDASSIVVISLPKMELDSLGDYAVERAYCNQAEFIGTKGYKDADERLFMNMFMLQYPIPNRAGMSFSLVLLNNRNCQHKIIGFHGAGNVGTEQGYALTVPHEKIVGLKNMYFYLDNNVEAQCVDQVTIIECNHDQMLKVSTTNNKFHLPIEVFKPIGTVRDQFYHRLVTETDISPTNYQEIVGPIDRVPVTLQKQPGEDMTPIERGMSSFVPKPQEFVNLKHKLLNKEHWKEIFRHCFRKIQWNVPGRKHTVFEAINGIPTYKHVKGIDMNTSAGPNFTHYKKVGKGKRYKCFQREDGTWMPKEQTQERMETLCDCYDQGLRHVSPIEMNPKVELRHKAKANKPRMFSTHEFEHSLLCRIHLSALLENCFASMQQTGITIGMNIFDPSQWSWVFFGHHIEDPFYLEGDVAHADRCKDAERMHALLDIICEVIQENYIDWEDRDERIIRGLLEDSTCTMTLVMLDEMMKVVTHHFGRYVDTDGYITDYNLKLSHVSSGCVATPFLQSMDYKAVSIGAFMQANMRIRAFKQKPELLRDFLQCYYQYDWDMIKELPTIKGLIPDDREFEDRKHGDDFVNIVPGRFDWFTMHAFVWECSTLGVTITPSDKFGEFKPYYSWEEVTYLKCSPVYDEDHDLVAQIQRSVIDDIWNWDKATEIPRKELYRQKVTWTSLMAVAHGKKVYTEIADRVTQFLKLNHYSDIQVPSYWNARCFLKNFVSMEGNKFELLAQSHSVVKINVPCTSLRLMFAIEEHLEKLYGEDYYVEQNHNGSDDYQFLTTFEMKYNKESKRGTKAFVPDLKALAAHKLATPEMNEVIYDNENFTAKKNFCSDTLGFRDEICLYLSHKQIPTKDLVVDEEFGVQLHLYAEAQSEDRVISHQTLQRLANEKMICQMTHNPQPNEAQYDGLYDLVRNPQSMLPLIRKMPFSDYIEEDEMYYDYTGNRVIRDPALLNAEAQSSKDEVKDPFSKPMKQLEEMGDEEIFGPPELSKITAREIKNFLAEQAKRYHAEKQQLEAEHKAKKAKVDKQAARMKEISECEMLLKKFSRDLEKLSLDPMIQRYSRDELEALKKKHQNVSQRLNDVKSYELDAKPQSDLTAVNENSNVEQKQLTSVMTSTPDGEVPGSWAGFIPFFREVDPIPYQGLDQILTRLYRIANFTWDSTQTVNSAVYSANFPYALFQAAPNLKKKIDGFHYFRSNVEIEIHIAGTMYHQGALMAAIMPFVDFPSNTKFSDIYTMSTLEHAVISPNTNTVVRMRIPFRMLSTHWDHSMDDNKGYFGSLMIRVLAPLSQLNPQTTVSLSCSVFARFIDPEVMAPTLHGIAQADMQVGNATTGSPLTKVLDKVEKQTDREADRKSNTGVLSKTLEVASGVSAFLSLTPMGAPLGLAVSSGMSILANLARKFGYDKPNSHIAFQPVFQTTANLLANGNGMNTQNVLGVDFENRISNNNSDYGTSLPQMDITYLAGLPGLFETGSFNSSATPGTIITDFANTPHRYIFLADVMQLLPCSTIAMMTQYWRGDMKYMIKFFCNKFVKAKVRISWGISADESVSSSEGEGDFPSTVIDIAGDTDFCFTVPYIHNSPYCRRPLYPTADADLGVEEYAGWIRISIVVPTAPLQTSTNTSVSYAIWCACAENMDFQAPYPITKNLDYSDVTMIVPAVAQSETIDNTNIRNVFLKEFTPLFVSRRSMMFKVNTGEHVRSIATWLHRFMHVGDMTIDTDTTAFYELPTQTGTEMAPLMFNIFRYWFHYFRGTMSYKLIPSGTKSLNATVMVENDFWKSDGLFEVGSQLHGMNGVTLECLPYKPALEFTVPFYSQYPFRAREWDYPSYYLGHTSQLWNGFRVHMHTLDTVNDGVKFDIYMAMSDDGGFGYPAGCPRLKFTPAAKLPKDQKLKKAAPRLREKEHFLNDNNRNATRDPLQNSM